MDISDVNKMVPTPKNGEIWWAIDMQHPEDGATPLEWWSEAKYGYTPIAQVLTPQEVAAKDAEIERLREAYQKLFDFVDHVAARGGVHLEWTSTAPIPIERYEQKLTQLADEAKVLLRTIQQKDSE